MKRLQLFEFHELKWFPSFLRNGVTDYLQIMSNKSQIHQPFIPILKRGLEKSKNNRIVDLCSGGGGGLLGINNSFKAMNLDFQITMSDKFPNLPAFKEMAERSGGTIDFIESPVDAMDVSEKLKGFRTLFLSFHHFDPASAKKILQNAVDCHVPIGIFEITDRNIYNLVYQCFMVSVNVWRLTPYIQPFRVSKWIFTYLIPLISLVMLWDTFVSVMRTYTVDELKQMLEEIAAHHYKWEIQKISNQALYLLGYPSDDF